MNSQRMEQSLKQILDECGRKIIYNRNGFQSAVFDLLDKTNYPEERLILKHAMDSDAFWMLLELTQITAESAQKAIGQIQSESHMTKEDAEIVVRCVIATYGGNPDIVAENTKPQQAVERKPQKEKKKHQEEVQKNKQEQGNQGQIQTQGTDTSRKKQIFTLIIFAIVLWVLTFLIFYFADELDMEVIPWCATVIAVPAACWMQKTWNASKKIKPFILKGVIPGIIWGLTAFALFFMISGVINSSYYNDGYYEALYQYLDSFEYEESTEIINNLWENNNGSFYYNGRQYGMPFEQALIFGWGVTGIVSILVIVIQKIVWNLVRKHKKS